MNDLPCPKCEGTLQPTHYSETVCLHRCSQCRGLWMPAGVVDALKEEWMSEALVDIGNPKEGRKLNRMTEVACPEGHGVMLQKSDPEQPHIWLEHCPVCEGVYLDAGEFTDLKYLTVVDWVKKLVAKPRG